MSGRRFASTVNTAAVKNTVTGLVSKANAVAKPVIFYSQVAGHVLRKIAVHQKLVSPGSFAEAQAGIGRFFTSFQTGAWKKVTIREAGYLAGQIGTVGGFFFIGEMIGRRNLSGYDIPGAESHGHH